MAITHIEYALFRFFRDKNVISRNSHVLELGEANWYGDVADKVLGQDIYRYAPADVRKELFCALNDAIEEGGRQMIWKKAKVFWETFLQPKSMTAIDFHGTEKALKLDLNGPVSLERQYQLVMNLGTAEHVFNVAQVFKTIHDYTAPGGHMLHGLPFSGWVDHGFYNFQPTFYWDLAITNQYKIEQAVYAELSPGKLLEITSREMLLQMAKEETIGKNSLIYVLFKKPDIESDFKIPMQGYYAGSLPSEAAELWKTLR